MTDSQTHDDIDLDQKVIGALIARGHRVTYEYPGSVCIRLGDRFDVWTGMHGFDAGSVNILDGDNTMEPAENIEAFIDGLDETTTDVHAIVDGWDAWAVRFQAALAAVEREAAENGTPSLSAMSLDQAKDAVNVWLERLS